MMVMRAWVEDNAAMILHQRVAAGMRFRRDAAVSQVRASIRWKFADAKTEEWIEGRTDEELLLELGRAQRASGLELDAIDVGAIHVGHRAGLTIRGEHWPYQGTQGCYSLFVGPRGLRQDLREVDRTPESFAIILRIRLRDGRAGLLHFPYAWDDEIEAWVPVNVEIGVDAGDYWPWPFVN